ncbi:Regulatory protein recX [Cystobacter fuscus DSM 2262]|uniref:Regulatory protein RecX n=1 Tax=Cystobacter fuscus (strain ATCC 25194 / DSM 2262 / NBRC 100088 / M29) TaxID=1242864 RepID=S9NU80_CYSF2|nr:regulatory protein RecX [Cystobacter fuscus]EPX55730.1 Regulatory protein recX [Cystobacter fuscus DSM 2262]
MDEPTGRERGQLQEKRKQPRKVSPRYLENAALHYLKRYSATVSQLKTVLMRRVDRSLRFHGGERTEALGWVNALVEKLVRNGLVNDQAYAETKAHSLRASGRSARVIAQKLKLKGVAKEVVAQKVAEASAEVSEEAAALIWARKKRLGPFRRDLKTRPDNRQRDLAAMARAGFSFAMAKKIIDGSADELPPPS